MKKGKKLKKKKIERKEKKNLKKKERRRDVISCLYVDSVQLHTCTDDKLNYKLADRQDVS